MLGIVLVTQAFLPQQQKDSLLFQEWRPMDDKSQGMTVFFRPIFQGKNIGIDEPLRNHKGDSLSLHTLRFYLSHVVFLKKGAVVFEENNRNHLLDLEDENTLELNFEGLGKLDFDQIKFNLGIDSLTHISGAMGGDLDPTKGMFWTWQSGYINVKLEGFFEKCPTRNHEFQFHLGGYLAPFQSGQEIQLNIPQGLSTLEIQLDLTPFFEQVNWERQSSIMSPSMEAVALSKILANSFSIHAK